MVGARQQAAADWDAKVQAEAEKEGEQNRGLAEALAGLEASLPKQTMLRSAPATQLAPPEYHTPTVLTPPLPMTTGEGPGGHLAGSSPAEMVTLEKETVKLLEDIKKVLEQIAAQDSDVDDTERAENLLGKAPPAFKMETGGASVPGLNPPVPGEQGKEKKGGSDKALIEGAAVGRNCRAVTLPRQAGCVPARARTVGQGRERREVEARRRTARPATAGRAVRLSEAVPLVKRAQMP